MDQIMFLITLCRVINLLVAITTNYRINPNTHLHLITLPPTGGHIYLFLYHSNLLEVLHFLDLSASWRYLHFLLSLVLHLGGQPKVTNLDLHVLIEQHVAQLEVAVDDFLLVDVASALYQMFEVVAHLRLRQRLPVLQHMDQGLQVLYVQGCYLVVLLCKNGQTDKILTWTWVFVNMNKCQ